MKRHMDTKIEKLDKRLEEAYLGGGEKRIDKQHAKKKLTARERIEYLMDEGFFEEMGVMVTHRCTDFGMENELYLCICTGFYGFWWRIIRDACRKNMQNNGPSR